MTTAKQYFSTYLADDVVRQLNHDLVKEILRYKPRSVFEFGCGQGKNLNLLPLEVKLYGFDISNKAVEQARIKGRNYVEWGDEGNLPRWTNQAFDVSFTCSVLDHIDNELTVDHILTDLKRISKKAAILYETQRNTPSTYYYPHPYEEYGFTKSNYIYYSTEASGGDGSEYHIWYWERKK